jgi:hypothetical protein
VKNEDEDFDLIPIGKVDHVCKPENRTTFNENKGRGNGGNFYDQGKQQFGGRGNGGFN